MKHVKFLSLMLVFLMIAAACATGGPTPSESRKIPTDTEPAGETIPKVGVPDDLTFDGDTIRLYTCENTLGVNPVDFSDEYGGDIVATEQHYRMLNIEDRLKIKFEIINTDVHTEMADKVLIASQNGDDLYDIVFSPALNLIPLVYEGIFYGLNELPYVDLSKPWWGVDYIESVSINKNNPFILFGDINWNYLQRCTGTFVNLTLLDDTLNMTSKDLYDIVLEGKWTQDKLYELQSKVYIDADGNSIKNDGDTFGFIHCGNWFFEYMMFGSGLKFTGRDDTGYPTLALYNEKTFDCIDSVGRFFWGNKTGFMTDKYADLFGNGQGLFMVNRIFLSDWDALRNMEDPYAIIPVPKYEESSDGYHCVVEKLVQWGVVPMTAQKTDMISAVAELMAYEGYKKVTPAYYETTLKIKRLQDEEEIETAKKIIDIICRGARTDFLYINQLNGMENIFTYVCNSYQNTFTSLYDQHEDAANMKLSELIEFDMAHQKG